MKNLINLLTESYSIKISVVSLALLIMISTLQVTAQPVLTVYSDAGKNIYSDLLIRSAFLGNYTAGNYQMKAGVQTNLINGNNTMLSGYRLDGTRDFKMEKILLELNGFGLWSAFSDVIQETNFGCLMAMKSSHFDLQFGSNCRTYRFRKNAIEKYAIEKNETKIHENFNLMYSFSYNLKQTDHKWNVGLTVTNFDHFMINQETNPYVNLKGFFKICSPVRLFAEAWYKTAGTLNMSSSYFGFLMRGGIVWNLN